MSDRPRPPHRAPSDCPVCADQLEVTRLGCASCGTELAGEFASCPFCSLDDADLQMLKVFLTSRGNLREVEKHLGVSYPTARARFTNLLVNLGFEKGAPAPAPVDRDKVLADVAAGVLSPAEAQRLLAEAR
ncbi:DUF2089 domain-containing protein [Enemella sp. A6]|uniref:DUF2089 domain-containing protein n=1 Tax=Enemella sp. A6 TaxID=3440152 RepID=UPI003EBB590D